MMLKTAARPVGLRMLGTIPQPPGGIIGTVNEAVKVPPPDKMHGSKHWTVERVVATSIVPLILVPFATSTGSLMPVLDATLGSLLIMHVHIGLESCIIDYIPKRVYGQFHKLAIAALWGGSAVALYGLYELEKKDDGLTESIRKIWNA
ncbi:mitochondrial inner membrane protein Shh4p [Trichomonascus vanleenenianus]|uniref:protein SHH4 n=1 Tax=Trichomonascus vanleenenianus TaxID=2268995 RepID=UPI003ECA6E35